MCPKTFKNTNTYYKHIRKDHSDKYADSSVANKYLLTANTPTATSSTVNTDSSGCSDSIADFVSNSDDNDIGLNPEPDNVTVVSDATKVASGHLIQLKCKAGVTQSILPSIVEMNEAVVDSVLNNVSLKIAERFQASKIGPEDPLATDIQEIIESNRNPLRSLHTIYCQNSTIQAHYPMVVSTFIII